MDHERVAALHDGRLGPRERDELLNELLSNDDEYDLFAETAAVLREIEEAHAGASPSPAADPLDHPAPGADAGDGVIPLASRRPEGPVGAPEAETAPTAARDDHVVSLESRRRGRPGWLAYGALAAGIAGLALTAALLTNRGNGPLDDPRDAVALLEDDGTSGRPARLGNPFRVTRNVFTDMPDSALAVRVGATLVDLEVAFAARNAPSMDTLSGKVVTFLQDPTLGGVAGAASVYRDIQQRARTGSLGGLDSLLAEGRASVRTRMAPEWLELGVWAETARIAAARKDAGFFRSRESRAALERFAALREIRQPLATVRGALPADGRIDWPAQDERWATLESSLTALLYTAGG